MVALECGYYSFIHHGGLSTSFHNIQSVRLNYILSAHRFYIHIHTGSQSHTQPSMSVYMVDIEELPK